MLRFLGLALTLCVWLRLTAELALKQLTLALHFISPHDTQCVNSRQD